MPSRRPAVPSVRARQPSAVGETARRRRRRLAESKHLIIGDDAKIQAPRGRAAMSKQCMTVRY